MEILDAIKQCNRIILFSIYDLQSRFNIAPKSEPQIELVDVKEVINDTVTFNKINAH